MRNTKEIFSSLATYISGALGLSYTIQDIESISSIICTVICIMSMLITLVITIINKIRKAKEDGVGKIKDQIDNKGDK